MMTWMGVRQHRNTMWTARYGGGKYGCKYVINMIWTLAKRIISVSAIKLMSNRKNLLFCHDSWRWNKCTQYCTTWLHTSRNAWIAIWLEIGVHFFHNVEKFVLLLRKIGESERRMCKITGHFCAVSLACCVSGVSTGARLLNDTLRLSEHIFRQRTCFLLTMQCRILRRFFQTELICL